MNNWNSVLEQWSSGNYFKYPSKLNKKFFWNTSCLTNDGKSKFEQSFKESSELPSKQNAKSFRENINKSNNKYATYFPNLGKDTILVVPMPRAGKNYATLKDFCDNAPIIQQKEFWKLVAKIAKREMKKHKKIWVSSHGLGVPYLHVRICQSPKYYFEKKFM